MVTMRQDLDTSAGVHISNLNPETNTQLRTDYNDLKLNFRTDLETGTD